MTEMKDCFFTEPDSLSAANENAMHWWKIAIERRDEVDRLRAVLKKIACFNDKAANERLLRLATYGGFDEPCSVAEAREALGDTE